MAQLEYRANLSAAVFPMTLSKAGRSVIDSKFDQNFDKRVDSPGDNTKAIGIPQAIYMENVLPTPDGYQSVGYTDFDVIEVPTDQLINAAVLVRLPSIVESIITNEGTPGTPGTSLFSSDASSLAGWSYSAFQTQNGFPDAPQFHYQTEVVTGRIKLTNGNADDNYVGTSLNSSGAYLNSYLYRNVNVGQTQSIKYSFDFKYDVDDTDSDNFIFFGGVLNDSKGRGIKVGYNTSDNTFFLATDASASVAGHTLTIHDSEAQVLTPGSVYRIELTLTLDAVDGTRDASAELFDTDLTTVLKTVTFTYPATVVAGAYIFFNTFNIRTTEFTTPGAAHFDNIAIETSGTEAIPGTTESVTKVSGFETLLMSFFSDNTVNWGRLQDAYENNAVTVPGGFVSPASNSQVSFASVRGESYLCFRYADETTKIYKITLSEDTITFTDYTTIIENNLPNPYAANDIVSITSSYNYFILATATTILWSSTTTPSDFAPSLVSGAGNEIPGNLKSDITFLKEHVSGFFIYTGKNVVFAAYTGNNRYPWKFREVGNSGGYVSSIQVSGDTNSPAQIGVNIHGQIQQMNPDSAENIAPEATDFFERSSIYDTFDPVTNLFAEVSGGIRETIDDVRQELPVFFFLDRYIMIPYGVEGEPTHTYNYFLVFDTLLSRFGKVKKRASFVVSNEKEIFFIERDTGTIKYLQLDIRAEQDVEDAMILLGKFQLLRGGWVALEGIELESSLTVNDVEVFILPSVDGKTFQDPENPYLLDESTGPLIAYLTHLSALNFCVGIKGQFDLNTVSLTFVPWGNK